VSHDIERLDWAIGGTSSSWIRQNDSGAKISHSQWRHWVDSRTAHAEAEVDEADMFPQPDGSTLEKGSMTNPATGIETEYEELWRDVEPISTYREHTGKDRRMKCIVLQLQNEKEGIRGMVVRLGQFCQGILREGDTVTVERWEWSETDGWKRTERIGTGNLPCGKIIDHDTELELDGKVLCEQSLWNVVEVEEWHSEYNRT
jgi:hypothetical protein